MEVCNGMRLEQFTLLLVLFCKYHAIVDPRIEYESVLPILDVDAIFHQSIVHVQRPLVLFDSAHQTLVVSSAGSLCRIYVDTFGARPK